MIIPLGASDGRRSRPWATLALVVVNFVISVAVIRASSDHDERLQRLWNEVLGIEQRIALDHTPMKVWAMVDATSQSEDPLWKHFWKAWRDGKVVPLDHPDHVEWTRAHRDFDDALAAHPFSRYGFDGGRPTVLGLFSSLFVHDGGLHLLFNMIFLSAVGASLENAWGRRFFLLTYLFAGVGANVIQGLATGGLGVGASGAVAGAMGAFAVRCSSTRLRFLSVLPSPGIYVFRGVWFLVPWGVHQAWLATRADAGEAGVGFAAHAGGFAIGVAIALATRVTGADVRELEPRALAERRAAERARLVEDADIAFQRGDAATGLAKWTEACALDPSDLGLRRRRMSLLVRKGDFDDARRDAPDLLAALWKAGDRAGFLEVFGLLEGCSARTALGPGDVHRAAIALEPSDVGQAARLHLRVVDDPQSGPLARRSLERAALLYERAGHADAATKLRAHAAALERSRASAG